MTWARIGQAGAETRTILELPAESTAFGTATMSVSTASPSTGSRSFGSTTNTRARGWTFASQVSLRSSFFFSYNAIGTTATTEGNLFRLTPAGVSDAYVRVKGSTGNIDMVINGSTVDSVSVSSSGLVAGNVTQQLGMVYYANASSGFWTVYLNGVAILSYTGNTGTGVTACYFMGNANTTGWTNAATMDDVYLDGSSTIETNEAPPARYFYFNLASTAGNYAQWTPLSGTNVANVDETTPDGDTTYVSAASANLLDSYNTSSPTVSPDYQVFRQIVTVYAKKSDAGVASTVAPGFRDPVSGDLVGSDIPLTINYDLYMQGFETAPDTGAWDATKVADAEVLIKSTGAY